MLVHSSGHLYRIDVKIGRHFICSSLHVDGPSRKLRSENGCDERRLDRSGLRYSNARGGQAKVGIKREQDGREGERGEALRHVVSSFSAQALYESCGSKEHAKPSLRVSVRLDMASLRCDD